MAHTLEQWQIILAAVAFGAIGLVGIIMWVVFITRRSNNSGKVDQTGNMNPIYDYIRRYLPQHSAYFQSAVITLSYRPTQAARATPVASRTRAGFSAAAATNGTAMKPLLPSKARPGAAKSNIAKMAPSGSSSLSPTMPNNDEYGLFFSWHEDHYMPIISALVTFFAAVIFVGTYTSLYLGNGWHVRPDGVVVDWLSWLPAATVSFVVIAASTYTMGVWSIKNSIATCIVMLALTIVVGVLPALGGLSENNSQWVSYVGGVLGIFILLAMGWTLITSDRLLAFFHYNDKLATLMAAKTIISLTQWTFWITVGWILFRYMIVVLSAPYTGLVSFQVYMGVLLCLDVAYLLAVSILLYFAGAADDLQVYHGFCHKNGIVLPELAAVEYQPIEQQQQQQQQPYYYYMETGKGSSGYYNNNYAMGSPQY